ncbi:MAG TPA: hypothetical protein VMR86_21170 [Myxococcota bacterium]|nr:hypothetical protein [Myxococcota bacterium]
MSIEHQLTLQSLETALQPVQNRELRAGWQGLEQTRQHEEIVSRLLDELGLEEYETPDRQAMRL